MKFRDHLMKLIACGLLLFSTIQTFSQTNEGNEFWFGFMEHVDVNNNEKVVMITSKFNTSGTVRIPNRNWSQSYAVAADQVKVITLPNYTENIGSEVYDNTGIQVTSVQPVSVYIHQYHQFRSEATVVLPVNSIGNSYFIMTYLGVNNQGRDYPSEFLIVGVEDETTIEIELSDRTKKGKVAGAKINISLDAGETYQVQAFNAAGDLSGSFIQGDKNFAVFSGNTWTEVPNGCSARDNLLEQMYAVNTWGRKIVTVPSARVSYDIFRIMAAEDNTMVTVEGSNGSVENYNINKGKFVEKQYSDAKLIQANKSILVGQFLVGESCGGYSIGDPSMLILNSVTQTRDTVTLFNSKLQNIQENFINIISLTSDIPLITIDGGEIPTSAETASVGSEGLYSYIRLKVIGGAHTIVSEGCGIIASAYGYGPAESYAYSGGASFNSINVNPVPDGGCLNDTVFFNANLPDTRYSFLWDLGDGEVRTEASFEVFYDELGSFPAQLILTDECVGTVDTFNKDVLISLRQAVETIGDASACEEGGFSLGATDIDNADYLWTGPNGFISEDQFPEITNAILDNNGEYQVVGIVSGCATFPSISNVEIFELPKPTFNQDSFYCNIRDEVTLSPGDFESYLWQDGSNLEELTLFGDGFYAVSVTNEEGCEESIEIFMEQRCPTEVFIPNVFSPNEDGINDEWRVEGHDITAFEIVIKNRWGEIIFMSKDENVAWDGKFLGKVAASDVYFYSLKIEGFRDNGEIYMEDLLGTVTLMR